MLNLENITAWSHDVMWCHENITAWSHDVTWCHCHAR